MSDTPLWEMPHIRPQGSPSPKPVGVRFETNQYAISMLHACLTAVELEAVTSCIPISSPATTVKLWVVSLQVVVLVIEQVNVVAAPFFITVYVLVRPEPLAAFATM